MAGKRANGTRFLRNMTTYRDIILILLSFIALSCAEHEEIEESHNDRGFILYVCYNPDSIWHLSECNDQCTARDYDGDAYCPALFAVQCERPATEFIRIACGLYYRQGTTQR